MYLPKLRMAMRIGGEYRLNAITGRHWRRFAAENGLDPDAVVARVGDLTTRAPEAFERAAGTDAVRALDSELPARLLDRVRTHAQRCHDALSR